MRLNKRGFTLVEISATVAILSVLLAISVPNFSEARKSSIDNVCISNAKILSTLVTQMCLEGYTDEISFIPKDLKTLLENGGYIDKMPECVMGKYFANLGFVFCTGWYGASRKRFKVKLKVKNVKLQRKIKSFKFRIGIRGTVLFFC